MIISYSKIQYYKNFYSILISTIVLFAIGFVVQYSAGHGLWKSFFFHQFIICLVALPLCFFIYFIKIKFLHKYAYTLFVCSFGLLVYVYFLGNNIMGATRWIKLFGFQIQPSEFVKIGFVLAISKYISEIGINSINNLVNLIIVVFASFVPLLLILKQPNLGTFIIMILIIATVLFISGLYIRYFVFAISIFLLSIPMIWNYILYDYQKTRIITFLNIENDILTTGYNVLQSEIAIGSGGLNGKGLLSGTQTQLKFLPEKHTDFAFTVLSEEFGLLGSSFVFIFYNILFISTLNIIKFSNCIFNNLVLIGIVSIFFYHFIINIGMVMGMLPVVGVPLPFISYGGSMLLSSMICITLILSINRDCYLSINTN